MRARLHLLIFLGHSQNYERSMLLDGHYGPSGTLRPEMILNAGPGRTNEGGAYVSQPEGWARGAAVYTRCVVVRAPAE